MIIMIDDDDDDDDDIDDHDDDHDDENGGGGGGDLVAAFSIYLCQLHLTHSTAVFDLSADADQRQFLQELIFHFMCISLIECIIFRHKELGPSCFIFYLLISISHYHS